MAGLLESEELRERIPPPTPLQPLDHGLYLGRVITGRCPLDNESGARVYYIQCSTDRTNGLHGNALLLPGQARRSPLPPPPPKTTPLPLFPPVKCFPL